MGITAYGLLALDLAGIFVFAIGGATLGVRRGLDLFGVLVLACVAATAGGIMRDVLIADAWDLPELPSALAAGTLCFVLRFMGIRYGWRLPVSRRLDPPR
jgi:uncharacterized membrane protein YeiH